MTRVMTTQLWGKGRPRVFRHNGLWYFSCPHHGAVGTDRGWRWAMDALARHCDHHRPVTRG